VSDHPLHTPWLVPPSPWGTAVRRAELLDFPLDRSLALNPTPPAPKTRCPLNFQRSAASYLQAALDPAALSPPEGAAALAAAAGGRPAGGIGASAGLVGGGAGLRPLVAPIEMRAMPVA
jgi:hypothetical protein